jgi:hypothetical protein
VRAIASSRSGPAANTPPTSRSQTSVVVRSSTDPISPSSTSFSMARPPVPVAWKTSGSTSSPSRSVTAVTHGVVTPNIVSPTAGRSAAAGIGFPTIPASACAALPSTCREIRFSPATSVTE